MKAKQWIDIHHAHCIRLSLCCEVHVYIYCNSFVFENLIICFGTRCIGEYVLDSDGGNTPTCAAAVYMPRDICDAQDGK